MPNVTLHFGDGSHHTINVEETNKVDAVEAAKSWVLDNAWLETDDNDDSWDDPEAPQESVRLVD